MGYPIYHSQYTAAQIEAAIGKGPRVNTAGYWEVWNVGTGAYESTGVGAGVTPPTVVTQVSQMTNHGYIYIYNGTETGYTAGYWYYWDGSAWTAGGAYQVAATDTTLSVAGAAADAKATGDAVKNAVMRESASISFWGTVVTEARINPTTGIAENKPLFCRTPLVTTSNYFAVEFLESLNSTYRCDVMFYDSTGNLSTGDGYLGYNRFSGTMLLPLNAVKIAFSVYKRDGTYMTSSDASAIKSGLIFYTKTDTSLTLSGVPADAEVVGNAINNLTEYVDSNLSIIPVEQDKVNGRWRRLAPLSGTITTGKYMNTNGNIGTSEYYDMIEFAVSNDKIYEFIAGTGGALPDDLSFITFLDNSNNVLYATHENKTFYGNVPSNCVKAVISYRSTGWIYCNSVETNSCPFTGNTLSDTSLQNLSNAVEFGTVNYVKKNINISVDGTVGSGFTKLIIRRGKGLYFSKSVTITESSVIVDEQPHAHGLTITDWLGVTIKTNETDNLATVSVYTNGGSYTLQDVSFYADGKCDLRSDDFYVYNAQIVLNDYQKDVRFYGDSYSGTASKARWPYQAAMMGARFMVNGLSGSDTETMFPQLLSDLSVKIPKMIIWGMGMNDGSGNPKSGYYARLKGLCDLIGVQLVFCTIPTVPDYDHSLKNTYIRSSGVRYIDFDAAVSNGVDATWKEGMLSTDNVHPTVLGALAMAQKAIETIPDLLS